jgi:hypothetical protein
MCKSTKRNVVLFAESETDTAMRPDCLRHPVHANRTNHLPTARMCRADPISALNKRLLVPAAEGCHSRIVCCREQPNSDEEVRPTAPCLPSMS